MPNDSVSDTVARVPLWLVESDVSANAVRVYALIAGHDTGGGGWVVPLAELSALVSLGRSTTKRVLNELVHVGAVEVIARTDPVSGVRLASAYRPRGGPV